jgi:transposase
MLEQKTVFEIQIFRSQSLSISAIARRLGIAPNTVRKYLTKERCQMEKHSKLDPFKSYIISRLNEYPEITDVVLLKEISALGYTGKITILRTFVHSIRPPKPSNIARFETEPGQQFQVDWGEGKTIIDSHETKVKFFVMVLGYSRILYAEIVEDEKLETLLAAHNRAFEYFGGVCLEGLYDNMKTVVKKIEKHKIYNEKFMDFANFYGFKVITHRPYNPQAKGKVERMVPYVRQNVLYAKSYDSMEDLKSYLSEWLVNANKRLHSQLKEIPSERFEKEKNFLHRIERFYPLRKVETRTVREGNRVIYQNRAYEVPVKAGQKVNIFQDGNTIKIYLEDKLVLESLIKMPVEVRSLEEYEKLLGEGI